MIPSAAVPTVKSRRPPWFTTSPQIQFDCRAAAPSAPSLQRLLQTAEQLSPGETLVLRLDYEPDLLCRILGNHGFTCWLEPDEAGAWRAFFRRVK